MLGLQGSIGCGKTMLAPEYLLGCSYSSSHNHACVCLVQDSVFSARQVVAISVANRVSEKVWADTIRVSRRVSLTRLTVRPMTRVSTKVCTDANRVIERLLTDADRVSREAVLDTRV